MAVAFYIPSVDEDEPVKPNQAYHHQQQQDQQQQQQQQPAASPNVSQQVCSAVDEYKSQQNLMLLFHEILVAYAREAILAQQTTDSPEPCLLCKKLYYLFRRIY